MAMKREYLSVDGEIFGEVTNGVVNFYDRDALGSVVAIEDGAGNTVSTIEYKPFGDVRTYTGENPLSSPRRFLWCGTWGYRFNERYAQYTSHYVRARHYSSLQGMWSTIDPLYPSERAYGYVENRVTVGVDSSGTQVAPPLTNQPPIQRPPWFPPIQRPYPHQTQPELWTPDCPPSSSAPLDASQYGDLTFIAFYGLAWWVNNGLTTKNYPRPSFTHPKHTYKDKDCKEAYQKYKEAGCNYGSEPGEGSFRSAPRSNSEWCTMLKKDFDHWNKCADMRLKVLKNCDGPGTKVRNEWKQNFCGHARAICMIYMKLDGITGLMNFRNCRQTKYDMSSARSECKKLFRGGKCNGLVQNKELGKWL